MNFVLPSSLRMCKYLRQNKEEKSVVIKQY